MRPATKKLSHQLIKHSKTPLFLAIFAEAISSLQIIHIILASTFLSSLKSYFSFSSFFRDLTKYSGAVTLFSPVADENALEYLLFVLLGYLAILILLFLALLLNEARGFFKFREGFWKALANLYLLHSRLFFFPVQYFFMGMIQIYHQCESKTSGVKYCEDLMGALAIIGCVLNVLVALVQEFLLYSIIKSKNAYAVKNNTFHRLVLLHKIVGIMVYVLQQLGNNDVVAGVMNIALSVLCSYSFYNNLPFYRSCLMKVRVIFNGITFGCTLTLLLVVFGVDKQVMEIPWVMLCFLSAKVSLGILREITKSILNGRINNPQKALYFLTLIKEYNFGHFLLDVKRINYPPSAILANGSLAMQNFEAYKIKEGKSVKEYENEVFTFILEKFNAVMNKYPRSVPLALYTAHIYAKRKGNIIQTLNILKKIENLTYSIALESSIEEFSARVKRVYAENHHEMDRNFALLEYFIYRDEANSVKEEIQIEAQKHMNFWLELKKEKGISCKKVFDLAYSVEELSMKIEGRLQRNMPGFTKTLANGLLLSKMYLEKLREMPNEARKNMKKFIAIVHNPIARHPLDAYSNDKAILILSLRKDHIGEILDASGSAQGLFQVEKNKMVGLGLSTIFPEVIAQGHTLFLNSFLKTSAQNLQQQIKTYGKDRDGNFFELQAKFQLYPEVDQEVKIMVFFKRVSSFIAMMLVGVDGTIVECSESLRSNLKGMNILVGVSKLQDFSSDYEGVNKAFNSVYCPKEFADGSGSAKGNRKGIRGGAAGKQNAKVASEEVAKMFSDTDIEKSRALCDTYITGTKLAFNEIYSIDNQETELDVVVEPMILKVGFYKVVILKNLEINNRILKASQKPVKEDEGSLFADEFPFVNEREVEKSKINFQLGGESFDDRGSFSDNQFPVQKQASIVISGGDFLMQKRLNFPLAVENKSDVRSSNLHVKKDGSSQPPMIELEHAKLSSSVAPAKTREVEREMSVASYATSGVYTIKSLKRIFTDSSTYTLPRNAFLITTLLTIFMLVLAVVFYSFSMHAIDEHEDNTNIIDGVGQRLAYAISSWQLITRLYLSRIGLGNDNVATIRENISSEALNLLTTNNEVNEELSLILEGDRLAEVFHADIFLWEPYENQTTTYHPINTFQATHILYDNLNEIVSQGVNDLDDISVDDLIYSMNNTANDYFLSCESLYTKTNTLMEVVLDSNLENLNMLLIGMSLVLSILGVTLLVFTYFVVQSYRRLFRALMKIEDNYIEFAIRQIKKLQTYLEVDIENSKFGVEDSGSILETRATMMKDSKKIGAGKRRTGFSNREDRFSVKTLTIFLLKNVFFSIIFIIIPAILFYTALSNSVEDFGELDVLDDQLSVAVKAQYQANLIMSIFYMEMMFRNDTTILIRDELPRVQLEEALDEMMSLHEELSRVFFSEGDLLDDAKVQMLLQENVCPLLENPTESLKESCLIATEGGELGLLSLNMGYITLSRMYVTMYTSNPTRANADFIVEPYSDAVREIMETLEASYDFLNDHLFNVSSGKVENFKKNQNLFFALIIISIVLAFLMVYFFSIKKYKYVDMGRGRILKMIPYQIIQDNRALDFYLKKDFTTKKFNLGEKY